MRSQKIKVLHLIKSLGRGGAEVLLAETLKLHDRERFEFHYIYFLPWKNQVVASLSEAGGTVTCMAASNNIGLIAKYSRVLNYIRANKIDLIHCHLPWAGFLGRLLFRFHHLPVIYTEHNKQERYHFVTRLLNKLSFENQSLAIAVSADVATSIRSNIRTYGDVRVIPNGVNADAFKREAAAGALKKSGLSIPSAAVVVGMVSVFRKQKRLAEWLDVFATTPPHVHGIVIGDGPLKAEILAHRKTLGLEARVHFPGLQHDVLPWLSAMDIFMMTSQFEGMPVALLEAMSCSCAVCVTDAGGIKQIVRDEDNGLIVPVDRWADLKDSLARLISDEPLRKRLGDSARKTVIAQFSMAKMVGELEALYILQSEKS